MAEAHPLQAAEVARELGPEAWFLISIAQEIEFGKPTSVAEAKLLAEISPAVVDRVRGWAKEMARGVPMQYVTGRSDFLGHVYEIVPGVLIPRPETEVLVLETIRRLENPKRGFEWGVGSGVISIELLFSVPMLEMTAVDLSVAARDLSLKNAQKILGPGAKRLEIREGWSDVDYELDLIVSNPPYLDRFQSAEFDVQVKLHEPSEALFAPSGALLHHYEELEREARLRLRAGGLLSLEVPHERALDICALFSDKAWRRAELLPDLTGRPRVCVVARS